MKEIDKIEQESLQRSLARSARRSLARRLYMEADQPTVPAGPEASVDEEIWALVACAGAALELEAAGIERFKAPAEMAFAEAARLLAARSPQN